MHGVVYASHQSANHMTVIPKTQPATFSHVETANLTFEFQVGHQKE